MAREDRFRHVRARVWSDLAEGEWPELSAESAASEGLDGRENVGVAFSGGGTRAAAAALGQLRALDSLGWIGRLRYIAAVSGGAWTSIPFTFLPSSTQDATFLGGVLEPDEITVAALDDLDWNSFAFAISQTKIVDDLLRHTFAGDERFSRAVGDVFLKPAGLDPAGRFFTQSAATLAAALSLNPGLNADDFHVARERRPFLVVTGTLLRPANDKPSERRFRFEVTPLYLGLRQLFPTAGSNGRPIGGGFVEPFGFDSDSPDALPTAGVVDVRLGNRHRFTLADVVGITGAAPAWALAQKGLNVLGFPEFKYWPPRFPTVGDKEYEFGDGGNLENIGIMPLLARKVARVVLFVNSDHTLVPGQIDRIADSVRPLFGAAQDGWMQNRVLRKSRFEPLVRGLWVSLESGGPAWHRETYDVLENAQHGVEGGWEVDVTWIYNQMPRRWYDRLGSSVRDLIGHGELANFPHYRTFFQNASIIDLSSRQVSLLAHLSCWACREALAAAEGESPEPGRGTRRSAGSAPSRTRKRGARHSPKKKRQSPS